MQEIQREEIPAHNPESGAKILKDLWGVTIPSVEVHGIVVLKGRVAFRFLENDQCTPYLAELSRVKADTQNTIGERIGHYPAGFIVDGFYTYSPSIGERALVRKYTPKVLENPEEEVLRLFPASRGIIQLTKDLYPKESPLSSKFDIREELGGIIFKYFSEEAKPLGAVTVELSSGYPIIICERVEDLHKFTPYPRYPLPSDTEGFSFVPTRSSRPGSQHKLDGSPFVVCLETASPDVRRQLYVTQLMFKKAVGRDQASPILVSRSAELTKSQEGEKNSDLRQRQLEEYLSSKIKDRLLAFIIRQPKLLEKDWPNSVEVRRFVYSLKRELFIDGSDMVIRKFVGLSDVFRTKAGRERLFSFFEEEIRQSLELTSEWPHLSSSRENQLVVANYLSLFPLDKWGEARKHYFSWEYTPFERSFGIPILR